MGMAVELEKADGAKKQLIYRHNLYVREVERGKEESSVAYDCLSCHHRVEI